MGEAKEKFSVLVVSGNEAERQAVIDPLAKAWPFEHEMALEHSASITDALEKLIAKRYALVVLDWDAAGDGAQFLHQMRLRGVRRPVIVLSTLRRDQIAEHVESLGAVFLNKAELNASNFHDAIAESLQQLRSGRVSIPQQTGRPASPLSRPETPH